MGIIIIIIMPNPIFKNMHTYMSVVTLNCHCGGNNFSGNVHNLYSPHVGITKLHCYCKHSVL